MSKNTLQSKSFILHDLYANTRRTGWVSVPIAWLRSPGFSVLTCWRVASKLEGGGVIRKLLATIIWRLGVVRCGCHISLKAKIGPRLYLPHPVGIVVGDGVVIGSDVTLYQNTTLGRSNDQIADYPKVGSGCRIYAGAVVLGGVSIGDRATVGANSVVLKDIPEGTTAVGAPARLVSAKDLKQEKVS